jgi:hypothetical protein
VHGEFLDRGERGAVAVDAAEDAAADLILDVLSRPLS